MSEQRIALPTAERIVSTVRNLLAATCPKIEIAGSIRRRSPDVKDAEIVAIPTHATYRVIEEMVALGVWEKSRYSDGRNRWGEKYRGFDVSEFDARADRRTTLRVELFMSDVDSWGYQLALRTGPADANKALMIWMQDTPIRCIDGAVWYAEDWQRVDEEWHSDTARRVIVQSEDAWFGLWGMGCMPPPYRTPRLYQHATFTPDAMVLGPAPVRQQSLFE